MKFYTKIICTYLLFSSMLISCTENIPAGLILKPTTIAKDTSYTTSTIPAPQLKNVLIEEFTGVRCPNCPKGASDLKVIQLANAPRVLIAKAHVGNFALPILNDVDLRCDDATNLYTILGQGGQPSAAVDRLLNSGTNFTHNIPNVGGLVAKQLAKPTPVNISIAKLINANKDSISLESTFIFTDTTSRRLAFNVYFLENKVVTHQDSFDVITLKTIEIEEYEHEEIIRKSITPSFVGTPFPEGLQAKGQVYVRGLQFAKPANVIYINNCVLLVFVHDRDTKEAIHCQQIDLK
jgi:hypothetical protein